MKYLLLILLFIVNSVYAQRKIAQIDDKDNYTNIRFGQGNNFKVVGTINNSELFYCEPTDTSDWYEVLALKWDNSGNAIKGYIHKSRIKIIENLKPIDQQYIIESVLEKQKSYAEEFLFANSKYDRKDLRWNSKTDSIAYRKAVDKLETYSETNYNAILEVLPGYFCKTNDEKIIQLLFEAIWADRGSANESPSFSIGKCFTCNSDMLIELLQQSKNEEKKEDLKNQIDWGLQNIFWTVKDGDNKPSNEEYKTLKKKLDKI